MLIFKLLNRYYTVKHYLYYREIDRIICKDMLIYTKIIKFWTALCKLAQCYRKLMVFVKRVIMFMDNYMYMREIDAFIYQLRVMCCQF